MFKPRNHTATFNIGDKVMYRGAWGADAPRLGIITGNDGEKNDQRVYDVELAGGVSHWGYTGQFTKVA